MRASWRLSKDLASAKECRSHFSQGPRPRKAGQFGVLGESHQQRKGTRSSTVMFGRGPVGRGLVRLREEPIELPTLPAFVEGVLWAQRFSTTLRFPSNILGCVHLPC